MKFDRFDEGFPPASTARPVVSKAQGLKDFVMGPVCAQWMTRAINASSAAGQVGLALWQEAGLNKDRFLRDGLPRSGNIRVHSNLRRRRGLGRSTVSRGIKALAKVGLITVVNQGPGKQPTVVIQNISVHSHPDDAVPF
jgi:hypothetical protein